MTDESSQRRLRLLVVVSHPHDFTHTAGTCGLHVQRGDAVTVVSVTGGIQVHNAQLEREVRRPREQQDPKIVGESQMAYGQRKHHELVEACALFGINDVRILPFPDSPLEQSPEVDQALADIILELRPHVLLTHATYAPSTKGHTEVGPHDHLAAGIAVSRARTMALMPDPETKRVPHNIAVTYYLGVEFPPQDWDLIVDITEQVENRVKAEVLFATQGHTRPLALKRIEVGAGLTGWHGGFAYGEAFLEPRPRLTDHLPVTDIELEHANWSEMEYIASLAKSVSTRG